MKFLEAFFEGSLWNSRYVVLFAVVGSLQAGFAIFYMATVGVVYLGGSIALVALAMYLTQGAKHGGDEAGAAHEEGRH